MMAKSPLVSIDVFRSERDSGTHSMNREYHKWDSSQLGREMELLIFGNAGLPVLAFPTSGGRFFDFEDRGMVAAVTRKLEAGELQLFCADSVDMESWYNRHVSPRLRILRHMQYERYLLDEVVPFIRKKNEDTRLMALGCSFGGYHAANVAMRHPDIFSGFLSLSGIFDLSSFLDGFYDRDCAEHLPTHYLLALNDQRILNRYSNSSFILATGWDDHCLTENQNLDRILTVREIPHQFHIWDSANSHDWPTWQRMLQQFL